MTLVTGQAENEKREREFFYEARRNKKEMMGRGRWAR